MSKAQTDIRTTSYDELAARPFGYEGTIDDALAQIRAEPDDQAQRPGARAELLKFLGIGKPKTQMSGRQRRVSMPTSYAYPNSWTFDEDALDQVAYYDSVTTAASGFYTLAYAQQRWPENFL